MLVDCFKPELPDCCRFYFKVFMGFQSDMFGSKSEVPEEYLTGPSIAEELEGRT